MTDCTTIILVLFCIIYCLTAAQDVFFGNYLGAKEFDSCRTYSGSSGECRSADQCPYYLQGGNFGRDTKLCGFDSRYVLLICCPKPSATILKGVTPPKIKFDCGKRGGAAIVFGDNFARSRKRRTAEDPEPAGTIGDIFAPVFLDNPITGELEPSIVGGRQSYRGAWPWMILIGREKNSRSPSFFCDGALINERYVLTAAHCLLEKGNFFVRLGEHDYSNANDGASPQDVDIESVSFNPKYNANYGYSDVAVVKLAKAVSITNSVRPICLPWSETSNSELVNKTLTVTGWGAEQFGGRQSSVLREVTVRMFDPSVCMRSYSTLKDYKRRFPNGMNIENILCAGDRSGGKDSCKGDSGGPIVHQGIETAGRYVLVGIVSQGYGCGHQDFPGLYAPIRNLHDLQWIKDVAFSS